MRAVFAGAAGRMGQALAQAIIEAEGIELVAGTVRDGSAFTAAFPLVSQLDDLPEFDVLIDFTSAALLDSHLALCTQRNAALMVGTTGLSEDEQNRIASVAKDIPVVFAPNTSVGVAVMCKLLDMAARLIGETSDIEVIETHHRHKKDAPSGTALRLGQVLADAMDWPLDEVAEYARHGVSDSDRPHRQIGFQTIRAGDVFGDHTVLFGSDGERLEITHKASSRMTFAKGAVRAARWLSGKPAGLYTMNDVLSL